MKRRQSILLLMAAVTTLMGCTIPWEQRETLAVESISQSASESTDMTEDPKEGISENTDTSVALSTEAVIGTLAEATGYSWSDVYIVIMNTVLTKPDEHTGIPSFALLPWNDREEPVLIVGYWQDPVAQEFTIYSFQGDVLIEVEHLEGSLMISQEEHRILCVDADGTEELYQYENDHLIKLVREAYSTENFEPVAFTSLKENMITDETIRDYIQ